MTVRDLLTAYETKRFCVTIPCTTCGAGKFRTSLEEIGPDEVILQLGELSFDEFYGHMEIMRGILKWLHYEWALFDPSDLDSIKNSPAYDYFHSFFYEREQSKAKGNENRIKDEARQAEARKMRAVKASHDLVNAVVRGDIKAVQGLLDKGGDPDFNRGPCTSTARQVAKLWGRDHYFESHEGGE